jgi:peptidase M28-like protein
MDASAPPPPTTPAARRGAAIPLLIMLGIALIGGGVALALLRDDDGSGDMGGNRFDAVQAFAFLRHQVELGPRPAGSGTSRKLAQELRRELPGGSFEPIGGGLRNVVGRIPGSLPAIVVGAHYDTEERPRNFVGANDGAAGTAAVVEIARALSRERPDSGREVRFVLFDGEEEPAGSTDILRDSLRGSKAYVQAHRGEVGEMVLLDYVAEKGVRIPREQGSDEALWAKLRQAAARVGSEDVFPPETFQGQIFDDHFPFAQAGIPAIDLIDFDYPYRDTAQDTPDKLSPNSLDKVGETVIELILSL